MMKLVALVVFVTIAGFEARPHSYGDESQSAVSGAGAAPLPAAPVPEQQPAAIPQAAPDAPAATGGASGYRRKRGNSYGDESQAAASSAGAAPMPTAPAPEQAPASIPQATAPAATGGASGYRKKRGNSYGDESQAAASSAGSAPLPAAPVPEQQPAAIPQAAPDAPAATGGASGYRRKRGNSYGDESQAATANAGAAPLPAAPVPEQQPAAIPQAAPDAPAATGGASGYRKKRGSYGDESQAAASAAGSAPLATAPAPEQAPAAIPQATPDAPAATGGASGYRRKRGNSYGDESQAATANAGAAPLPAAPVPEQQPAAIPQATPDAPAATGGASGYRRKRGNSYGDESQAATANAGAAPLPAAPVPEQVPAAIPQAAPEAPAATGSASGY